MMCFLLGKTDAQTVVILREAVKEEVKKKVYDSSFRVSKVEKYLLPSFIAFWSALI